MQTKSLGLFWGMHCVDEKFNNVFMIIDDFVL